MKNKMFFEKIEKALSCSDENERMRGYFESNYSSLLAMV